MDGGLDLDFHGFTRLFLSRGLLTHPVHDLCQRLYAFIRATLPPPELIVSLKADSETVTDRMSGRKRINIARAEDTALFNSYLEERLESIPSNQVLSFEVSNESMDYAERANMILANIQKWI